MPEGKDCVVCGQSDMFPRRCNECGQYVCTEHRLPEKHACLETIPDDEAGGSWFDEKFAHVRDSDRVQQKRERPEPGYVEPNLDVEDRHSVDGPRSPDVNVDGSLDGAEPATDSPSSARPEQSAAFYSGRYVTVAWTWAVRIAALIGVVVVVVYLVNGSIPTYGF